MRQFIEKNWMWLVGGGLLFTILSRSHAAQLAALQKAHLDYEAERRMIQSMPQSAAEAKLVGIGIMPDDRAFGGTTTAEEYYQYSEADLEPDDRFYR